MTRTLFRPVRPLALLAMVALGALLIVVASAARGTNADASGQDVAHFRLVANPKFASCLARFPGDANRAPQADVTVRRGDLNDKLEMHVSNIKPDLAFDLFTVQRSSLRADGKPDPAFTNFGMAWYQSDVQADHNGSGDVTVRTILLDQIFGFDPDVKLPPTNTFQLGFWFNDPKDAQACGFNPAQPTPFNGEHRAGPLAMISVPDAQTGLGPLCVKPDASVTPARCNP